MSYVRSCSLNLLLCAAASSLVLSSVRAETPPAFNDPTPYCKSVGTIDAPDSTYKGPAAPDWMIAAAYPPEAIEAQRSAGVDPGRTVVWRCAAGAVLICVQGNSPQCGKATTSKTPTEAMRDFCTATPNAEIIPLSVIGHENPMIYDWGCRDKEPVINRQVFKVDAQGYPAEFWQKVSH